MSKAKAPAAKVTFQAKAYKDMRWGGLEDVVAGKEMPLITEGGSYYDEKGYALIGTVEVTLTLHSTDKIVQNHIEALKKQLQEQRAAAHLAEMTILEKIGKLQALTMDSEVTA